DPESTRDSDLIAALNSPLDYTALPLVAHWDKEEPSRQPGKKRITYVVDIAADPSLIDTANNNHVLLDFVALAKTPDGHAASQPAGNKVDLHPSPEHLATIRQQ